MADEKENTKSLKSLLIEDLQSALQKKNEHIAMVENRNKVAEEKIEGLLQTYGELSVEVLRLRNQIKKEKEAKAEFIKELRSVLALCNTGHSAQNPSLSRKLELIGDQYGYGASMNELSYLWRKLLIPKGLEGGEFAVGPCVATVASLIKQVDEFEKQDFSFKPQVSQA